MKNVLDILRVNEPIVYFAYGQAFFTLGLILALQSRKHSRLALAHHLKWLAAFGIVHGVYEWGHAFIPIQATYLSPETIAALEGLRTALLVLSFCLLLQFGTLISCRDAERSRPWRLVPFAVFLIWLALSSATNALGLDGFAIWAKLPEATDLARIVLGFPGAALASFGMVRQARIVGGLGSPRITRYFLWAAVSFAVYAVAAGLIASRGEWTLLALVGSPLFTGVGAIPPPVLRPLAAFGVAFGVIRGLAVFQVETDALVEERDELERRRRVGAHLLAQVIAVQEEERKRLARELHDETGQHLSAVIMGLGTVAAALPPTMKAVEILDDVREEAIHTLDSVRQIILGLRPALLDDLGLAPALRRVAEDLAKFSSARVEVLADGIDKRLSPELETALFRILQEGMNNVARHAEARHAVLRLTRNETEVRAVLEDDGIGFDPAEATAHLETGCGLGLVGMRERAQLLGGSVAISSHLGCGTIVEVRLPYQPHQRHEPDLVSPIHHQTDRLYNVGK